MEERTKRDRLGDVVVALQLAIRLCPASNEDLLAGLRTVRERALIAMADIDRREKQQQQAQGGQP